MTLDTSLIATYDTSTYTSFTASMTYIKTVTREAVMTVVAKAHKAKAFKSINDEILRVGIDGLDRAKLVPKLMKICGVGTGAAYRWISETCAAFVPPPGWIPPTSREIEATQEPQPPHQPAAAQPATPGPQQASAHPTLPTIPAPTAGGEVTGEGLDVRKIRDRMGMTQNRFAGRFGFSPAAVRQWERGARKPEMAARVLLLLIGEHPELVADAADRLYRLEEQVAKAAHASANRPSEQSQVAAA